MSIAAIVRALVAAKATPEMILAAVEAAETERDDALERRRQNDRDRKARQRELESMSREVTGSHNDRQPSSPHARVEDSSSKEEVSRKENKRGRAMRLPPDWQIPEPWIEEAIAAGLSRSRAFVEANKMLNWSLSDKNGAKLDWLATWRNWVQRVVERTATGPPGKPKTIGQMFVDDAKKLGILPHDTPDNSERRLGSGDGATQGGGSGISRQFAVTSNQFGKLG